MCKQYVVCLCFDRDDCEETTKSIAQKNNATEWFVEPVYAPLSYQLAHRGIIIKEVCQYEPIY